VTAVAASVFSRAVLIEPPTCWLVLVMADATPANWRSTPRVAVCMEAGMIVPMAAPMMSSAGRTWPA